MVTPTQRRNPPCPLSLTSCRRSFDTRGQSGLHVALLLQEGIALGSDALQFVAQQAGLRREK